MARKLDLVEIANHVELLASMPNVPSFAARKPKETDSPSLLWKPISPSLSSSRDCRVYGEDTEPRTRTLAELPSNRIAPTNYSPTTNARFFSRVASLSKDTPQTTNQTLRVSDLTPVSWSATSSSSQEDCAFRRTTSLVHSRAPLNHRYGPPTVVHSSPKPMRCESGLGLPPPPTSKSAAVVKSCTGTRTRFSDPGDQVGSEHSHGLVTLNDLLNVVTDNALDRKLWNQVMDQKGIQTSAHCVGPTGHAHQLPPPTPKIDDAHIDHLADTLIFGESRLPQIIMPPTPLPKSVPQQPPQVLTVDQILALPLYENPRIQLHGRALSGIRWNTWKHQGIQSLGDILDTTGDVRWCHLRKLFAIDTQAKETVLELVESLPPQWLHVLETNSPQFAQPFRQGETQTVGWQLPQLQLKQATPTK